MLFKYISVGLFNTFLTFLVMYLLYFLFSINYMISYSVGYAVGYISSLILNNIFTFKEYKNKFNMQYYVKFTFFFLIAFLLSKIFVFMAVEVFSLSVYIGFLIGMLMYTFSSYLMFKKYVYKGSAQ